MQGRRHQTKSGGAEKSGGTFPQEISCISGPLRFILMHYEGRKYYVQVYLIVNKDSGNRQAYQTQN